ncbi:MAG: hypothetical protein GY713_13450 [Actinomycetia bacterium]|nr:hypothetical protein [Actinomycetes bacterium]
MSTGALDRRVAAARQDPSQADVDELVSGTQRRIMIGELTAAVLVAYGLYISISIGERWGLAAGIGLIAPPTPWWAWDRRHRATSSTAISAGEDRV